MAKRVFGIDFGTTNSLVSFIDDGGSKAVDLTNLDDGRPHPSVVWYRGGEKVVGRAARKHLDSGSEAVSGDFVRSPKRLLTGDAPVYVAGREIDPSDVVSEVLQFLRVDAGGAHRGAGAMTVDRAVFTIPVELDGAGRRQLRRAARKAGISVVQFVHEPLAALYGYLRSQPDYRRNIADLEGKRLLVFDWGGGTLDLTVCVVNRGCLVQLASRGENAIGGDVFDERIRNLVRTRHGEEHRLDDISSVEAEGVSTQLLSACERAKIELSSKDNAPILVKGYLRGQTGQDLVQRLTKADMESIVQPLVREGLSQIDKLLSEAGLSVQDIALCLPTGGMVQMPLVREGLLQKFGARAIKLEAGDRIIAQGAAWIAHDGLQLQLAKPIELLQPDNSYHVVVEDTFALPVEDHVVKVSQSLYYCVDPRDGVAHFHFARPARIGQGAQHSERLAYKTVSVKVDPNARPFVERLKAEITIDSDYVVMIEVSSTGRLDRQVVEIYNLEFALALPSGIQEVGKPPGKTPSTSEAKAKTEHLAGSVRLRSNVTFRPDHWSAVPGDILTEYRPTAFSWMPTTERQLAERYYYQPCAVCRRLGFDCQWDGCDNSECLAKGMISQADARDRRAGETRWTK